MSEDGAMDRALKDVRMPHAAGGTADTNQLSAASLRAWRIALVAYLVPITVLTHWPRFGIAGAGVVDKFVHFVAFGSLAWLAMHAAQRGRVLVAWIAAAAWVYVDEITQSLEILGRTFSLADMVAGWIGVAMAGAIYWTRSLRAPRGSRVLLDGAMYGDGASWVRAALVVVASVVVVGGAMFAARVQAGAPAAFPTAVYPIGFAALVGLVLATALGELRAVRSTGLAVRKRAWPIALGAVPILAGVFFASYLGFVRVFFGVPIPEDARVDHEGFLVLREGFLFVAVVLAFEVVRQWAIWCGRDAGESREPSR
ncbi:MAG: hypothetical protein RL591_981 [Planctomycetota bacterium]|jgi:hypothetical protein